MRIGWPTVKTCQENCCKCTSRRNQYCVTALLIRIIGTPLCMLLFYILCFVFFPCVLGAGNAVRRSCRYYAASGTSSGSTNYDICTVTLCNGDTLSAGCCEYPTYSMCQGDTLLRLVLSSSSLHVTYNDDACGVLSQLSYTKTTAGCEQYEIREGCYSSSSCSGTIQYTIDSLGSPTVFPTLMYPSVPSSPPAVYPSTVPSRSPVYSGTNIISGVCDYYSISGSCNIRLCPGDDLTAGCCHDSGDSCFGDTMISLHNNNNIGYSLTTNDDFCGVLSQISYHVPSSEAQCSDYTLSLYCYFSSGCGGNVAYTIERSGYSEPTEAPSRDSTGNVVGPIANYYSSLVEALASSSLDYSSNSYTSCDYRDACNASHVDAIPSISHPGTVFQNLTVDMNFSAARVLTGRNVTDDINDVCYGDSRTQYWSRNLENDLYNSLAWQYIGYKDSGSFSMYPFGDSPTCGTAWDPRSRPWYLSAVTGPIDLWILIDVSSGESNFRERILSEFAAAESLLRSLNYWSFFNVGIYSSAGVIFHDRMMRATSTNIALTISLLQDAADADESASSLYVNLHEAFEVMKIAYDRSRNDGATSNCNQILVLLSGTRNDFPFPTPDVYMSNRFSAQLVVLSFVFNYDNVSTEEITPLFEDLACSTNGVHNMLMNSSTTDAVKYVMGNYSQYCGIILDNNAVRYSEIYRDTLGLDTDVITAVKPLYKEVDLGVQDIAGVFGIDIVVDGPLSNYGEYTHESVMSYLAEIVVCSFSFPSEIALRYVRGAGRCIGLHEDAYSADNYRSDHKLLLEESKAGYEALGSILYIIGFLGTCTGFIVAAKVHGKSYPYGAIFMTGLVWIPCGISLLVIIFSVEWRSVVVATEFTKSSMTVIDSTVVPYECCRLTNCDCSLAPPNTDTCDTNMELRREGACDNGYYCCETQCSECNCVTDSKGVTTCETCCSCVVSVTNRQCETQCGTCYTATAVWEYVPEEEKSEPDPLNVVLDYSKSCAMDDRDCAQGFVHFYSVGSNHTIFYNPSDYRDTEKTNDLPPSLTAIIVASSILIGATLLALIHSILNFSTDYKKIVPEIVLRTASEPSATLPPSYAAAVSSDSGNSDSGQVQMQKVAPVAQTQVLKSYVASGASPPASTVPQYGPQSGSCQTQQQPLQPALQAAPVLSVSMDQFAPVSPQQPQQMQQGPMQYQPQYQQMQQGQVQYQPQPQQMQQGPMQYQPQYQQMQQGQVQYQPQPQQMQQGPMQYQPQYQQMQQGQVQYQPQPQQMQQGPMQYQPQYQQMQQGQVQYQPQPQ